MKIFHGLVNYGTQSGYFARKLREKGIEAYSVTKYDCFDRQTDITLKHSGQNLFQKVYNFIWNKFFLLYCFFKYDIFHFYAGKTLTRSRWDLPLYRLLGKKVVFEYLGSDVQLYRYSVENFKFTNIIYKVNEKDAENHDQKIREKLQWHRKYADLQIVCAPCYSPFVPGSTLLPLGLDLNDFTYSPMEIPDETIKVLHAPTHRGNKGTKFIIGAIDRLIKEGYPIEKVLVENVTHIELRECYRDCHIFIDQLLAGWYGTESVEAMAIGRPVVCYVNQEFFKYVDYGEEIPIIDANPESIYTKLKLLLENKQDFKDIGLRGHEFVKKVHSLDHITDQLLQLYHSIK